MNYYELLEVAPNASSEVIKNAYKTLAKKFHPDTYSGDRNFAEEKMKLLNEAISVLENEEKRKLYDEENNISSLSSFSTVFSPPDLSETFMDDIDNFLNKRNKKASGTLKNKKQTKKYDDFDIDTAEEKNNISKIDNIDNIDDSGDSAAVSEYSSGNIRESLKKVEYYDEDEDDDIDIDKYSEKLRKSRRSNNEKIGKWFYITVAVLIAGSVLLLILISQMIKFDNLRGFISGGADSGINNIFNGGYDDYDDIDDDFVFDIDFEEIPTEPAMEGYLPFDGIPVPITSESEEEFQNTVLPTQAPTPAPTQPPPPRPTNPPVNNTPIPTPAPTQPPTQAPEPVAEPTTEAEELLEPDEENIPEETTLPQTDEPSEQEDTTEDTDITDTDIEDTTDVEENPVFDLDLEEEPLETEPADPIEQEVEIPEH